MEQHIHSEEAKARVFDYSSPRDRQPFRLVLGALALVAPTVCLSWSALATWAHSGDFSDLSARQTVRLCVAALAAFVTVSCAVYLAVRSGELGHKITLLGDGLLVPASSYRSDRVKIHFAEVTSLELKRALGVVYLELLIQTVPYQIGAGKFASRHAFDEFVAELEDRYRRAPESQATDPVRPVPLDSDTDER